MMYKSSLQQVQYKLNSNVICYLIALFPMFSLAWVKNTLGNEFVQAEIFLSFGILACLTIYRKILYISPFTLFYFLYSAEVFFITYLHQGLSIGLLVSVVNYCLLFSAMQTNIADILEAYCVLASAIIVINFFSVLCSNGTENYFIGGKNRLSIIILPSLVLIFTNSIRKNGKISGFAKVLALIGVVSILLARSGTGMLVAMLAVVFYLLFDKIKINKKIVLILILTAYVGLIAFTNALLDTSFWIRIAAAVGKNSDLTGRTLVWSNLIKHLQSNWLFGLGKEYPNVFKNAWNITTVATEAHNYLLELFLDGGLVAFVLYLFAFLSAVKSLDTKDEMGRMIFLGVILVLTNGFTESVVNIFPSIMLLAIGSNISKLKVSGNQDE